jgi:hypothetical protein
MRWLSGRRLLWALAVSLLVHLLMVAGTEFSLPDWAQDQDRIVVTLAPLPPPKPAKKPTEKSAPEPIVQNKPKPIKAIKANPKPLEPPPTPEPVAQSSSIAAPVVATAPIEPPPVAEPAPELAPIADEPIAIPSPPKRVEIEFSGFNGSKGSGKQLFELTDDGHYKLTGEMSIPVVLFISGSIEQHSEGLVTPKGLQPVSFQQKTTGSKRQQANFDWTANRVTLDTGKRTDVLDLPPGTQDFLSFMYQFMFVPPLDDMRLNIVTGKKLKTYLYEFEGEESLTTKMGALRTVHIARTTNDGDEKTELWLSVDHRHLPVRIRKTDKDGAAIDLIATRLNIIEQ